jgi:hypothetical protein
METTKHKEKDNDTESEHDIDYHLKGQYNV